MNRFSLPLLLVHPQVLEVSRAPELPALPLHHAQTSMMKLCIAINLININTSGTGRQLDSFQ